MRDCGNGLSQDGVLFVLDGLSHSLLKFPCVALFDFPCGANEVVGVDVFKERVDIVGGFIWQVIHEVFRIGCLE